MTLTLRPLSIRLRVAYMATAMREFTGCPMRTCDAGSTWERLKAEDWDGARHPYTQIWQIVARFYQSQGLDKLCDAEIIELYEAAATVGFKLPDGRKVPATMVHNAVKAWRNRGWFRYEQQHAGRIKVAKRVGLLGLFVVGVPVVDSF